MMLSLTVCDSNANCTHAHKRQFEKYGKLEQSESRQVLNKSPRNKTKSVKGAAHKPHKSVRWVHIKAASAGVFLDSSKKKYY